MNRVYIKYTMSKPEQVVLGEMISNAFSVNNTFVTVMCSDGVMQYNKQKIHRTVLKNFPGLKPKLLTQYDSVCKFYVFSPNTISAFTICYYSDALAGDDPIKREETFDAIKRRLFMMPVSHVITEDPSN